MSSGIKDYLGAIYGNLGMIQARMGDPTLAERYMHLAVQEGQRIGSAKYTSIPYMALAAFHQRRRPHGHGHDVCARKAIARPCGARRSPPW
jgi:hypothetical protein